MGFKGLALNLLISIAFFGVVAYSIAFYYQSPTSDDLFFVKQVIELSKDMNIPFYGDLDYDYWLENEFGKKLPYEPQTIKKWSDLNRPLVALTWAQLDCNLIKKSVIDEKKIYLCN